MKCTTHLYLWDDANPYHFLKIACSLDCIGHYFLMYENSIKMWFKPKCNKAFSRNKKKCIVQRERVSKEFSTPMPSKKLYLYLLRHRVKAFRYKKIKTQSKTNGYLIKLIGKERACMECQLLIIIKGIYLPCVHFFFLPILRPFWHKLSPVWDIGKWDIWVTYYYHLYVQT